jgi:hypothetical protein
MSTYQFQPAIEQLHDTGDIQSKSAGGDEALHVAIVPVR